MPLETNQELLQASKSLLQWLGVPSLAGFLSLYCAWLAFPPELIIESVIDKSKKFNSESKIKIKNNGRLPAIGIKADVSNLCAKIGGIHFNDCGIFNGPDVIGKLSYGETSEISIRPGMELGQSMHISEFSYVLRLKYQAKLFYLRKELSKQWQVSLRNFEDGYSWDIKII